MIIVDLHQTMISNMMMHMKHDSNIESGMFKHMVLNSLRSYRQKFVSKYGELIIATDTGKSWRNRVFPYYKANRKKDKETSSIDWSGIFELVNEIKDDLEEYFPYRIIRVNGAEADDVIATLCHKFGSDLPGQSPILIVSGDKDFKQLQTYMNVDQYDPVRSRALTENNAETFKLEHIIKGDTSDGVPNILSDDNCLVIGTRQGTMTKKRLEAFMQSAKTGVWEDSKAERNFKRNQQLIDLDFVPEDIQNSIMKAYEEQINKPSDKILTYLMKNRMRNLMEHLNEF